MTDEEYKMMVEKGIASCHRGDVFQIVLSRRFQQKFIGDEFNVYRALRSVNPSPYLFFFDYGDYKLMGSSPEAQIVIQDGTAIVHPIAGTFKRTGDAEADKKATERLLEDAKENATLNNLASTAFFAGDVIDICNDEFFTTHDKPDVIITDPPRAGMHEKLVKKILDMAAPTVVYVSCNPATQARDLLLLDEKYVVTKVQPVDMFPHTHHIENVVQLKLKS